MVGDKLRAHKLRAQHKPLTALRCADGALFEGMTSNFFAVIDGKLCTAGDGILMGTV